MYGPLKTVSKRTPIEKSDVFSDPRTLVPRALYLPRERTLVSAARETPHDKLHPSQGSLVLLLCLQGPKRDSQADRKAREMREIWRSFMRSAKNRLFSRTFLEGGLWERGCYPS